tara:strand:+ start:96 stop:578 length:483 start_codon:yes stop_codon:yes gene_type:complete
MAFGITGLDAVGSNLGIKKARNIQTQNRMAGSAMAKLIGDIESEKIINEHQAKATEYAGAQAGKAARTKGLTSMLGSIASPFVSWGTNSLMNNMGSNSMGSMPNSADYEVNPIRSDDGIFGMPTYEDALMDANQYDWGSDAGYGSSSSTNLFGYNSPHAW